jgi:hypothetical protein
MKAGRVSEGISEGFHLVELGWRILRGAEAVSLWLIDIGEFESTGSLEVHAYGLCVMMLKLIEA